MTIWKCPSCHSCDTCSLHSAAEAMLQALKQTHTFITVMADERAPYVKQGLAVIERAIAAAEPKGEAS